jgi:hypothetical protein
MKQIEKAIFAAELDSIPCGSSGRARAFAALNHAEGETSPCCRHHRRGLRACARGEERRWLDRIREFGRALTLSLVIYWVCMLVRYIYRTGDRTACRIEIGTLRL